MNIAENLNGLYDQAQVALNGLESSDQPARHEAIIGLNETLARIREFAATHENLHHGLLQASQRCARRQDWRQLFHPNPGEW